MIRLTDEEILACYPGALFFKEVNDTDRHIAKAQLRKVWDEWKATKVVLLDLENHPVAYDRDAVEAFWDALLEEVKDA